MNIVVLCGVLSREREVSLCTGSMVLRALRKKGHQAVLVDVIGSYEVPGADGKRYIDEHGNQEDEIIKIGEEAPDINTIRKQIAEADNGVFGRNVLTLCKAADIVFMALHGEDGEDGKIQAAFDMLGVKYTGAGYLGSAVAMSKRFAKQIFAVSGIPTPAFTIMTPDNFNENAADEIGVPCVVKVSSSGSSIGVYIVKDKAELQSCIENAFNMENQVVVEEFIEGREFTCGVLGDMALPLVEIIPKGGFYDYMHKYQAGATEEVCPAVLDEETTQLIQQTAVKTHQALALEVYSRIDFMMDEAGNIYCLEANTLPGMTPTSLLPQEAQAVGIGYEELCEKIISLSLKKYE